MGGYSGDVACWNWQTQRCEVVFRRHSQVVFGLTVLPYVLIFSRDLKVIVLDKHSGQMLQELTGGHTVDIRSISCLGRNRIATADMRGVMCIYDFNRSLQPDSIAPPDETCTVS